MPMFIVGGRDSQLSQEDFVTIRAASKRDALNLYAQEIGIQDKTYLEFIYETTVNMSFAEQFWLETEEEKQRFDSGGDVVATDEIFSERVKAFFRDHPEWGDLYLDAYFGGSPDKPMSDFPAEMLLFIFSEIWINDVVAIEIEVPTRDGQIGLPVGPDPVVVLSERLASRAKGQI